jgi:hypothetical protein
MRTQILLYAFLILGIFISSCADTIVEEDSETATINKIINGNNEGQELATVAIGTSNSFFCTGTLIAKNVVLSAGHCVGEYDNQTGESYTSQLGQLYVFVVENGQIKEQANVIDIIMHPGWDGDNLDDGVDLSLFYLDRNLSPAPIALDSTPPEQRINSVGKAVGYGLTNGLDRNSNANQEKMSVKLRIDAVGAGGRLISLSSTDATFRGTCNGDSGGPYFTQTAIGQVLTGVTSFGDRDCQETSFNVSVYYHSGWIRQNLNGAVNGNRILPIPSCDRLYSCLYQCSDSNCANECEQKSYPIAISEFNAYVNCADQNGCSPFNLECSRNHCQRELQACATKDDDLPADITQTTNSTPINTEPSNAGATTVASDFLNCGGLYECLSACDPNNQSCIDQCVQSSSEYDVSLINVMLQCFNNNQCQDTYCVNTYCTNEVINCFGYAAFEDTTSNQNNNQNNNQNYSEQTEMQSTTNFTCADLYNCLSWCDPSDQQCINDCSNQASYETMQNLNEVYNCINIYGCTTESCVQENCSYEIDQCNLR